MLDYFDYYIFIRGVERPKGVYFAIKITNVKNNKKVQYLYDFIINIIYI